jgi:hypothetical protein
VLPVGAFNWSLYSLVGHHRQHRAVTREASNQILSATCFLCALSAGSWDYLPLTLLCVMQAQVSTYDAHVVKAFCNLSAYSLHHGDPLTEHMKT